MRNAMTLALFLQAAASTASAQGTPTPDEVTDYLNGLDAERDSCCRSPNDENIPGQGRLSAVVRGRTVVVTMPQPFNVYAQSRAEITSQYAVNVIYHVFEHFPPVRRVRVNVTGLIRNEYGEAARRTALRLSATRAQFTRLRSGGDFSRGPIAYIALRTDHLERVLRLLRR